MPRRTAGPGLGNRDGGAVLGSESMCNYTDNLPCRRMSIRACWFFFFLVGWLVALGVERVWIFIYFYSTYLSCFAPVVIHRYLQRDGRARRFPLPVCEGSCEEQAQRIL